jgi:hypothetical protein
MEKLQYGPQVGSHLGKPIYKTIEGNGYKFEYDRLAQCDSEGCPLDQLETGEVLINPGLIYRQVG